MSTPLHDLPIEQRIRLVEDLWDSIAADQRALQLTDEQRAELDARLAAYATDGNAGKPADEVLSAIRSQLHGSRSPRRWQGR